MAAPSRAQATPSATMSATRTGILGWRSRPHGPFNATSSQVRFAMARINPIIESGGRNRSMAGITRRPPIVGRYTFEEVALPARTLRVTLECAGNGRAQVSPRYPSIPWIEEGVSTADWTGVPLAGILRAAGLRAETKEIVFWGADRGS